MRLSSGVLGALIACHNSPRDVPPAPGATPTRKPPLTAPERQTNVASDAQTDGARRHMTTHTVTFEELRTLLWPSGSAQTAFRPVSEPTRTALGQIVARLGRGVACDDDATIAALATAAHNEQWNLQRIRVDTVDLWLLRETQSRGNGVYLFRSDGTPPRHTTPAASVMLLQAPHAYHDVGTGELALALFLAPELSPRVRALFANNTHRYMQLDGTKAQQDHNPADAAHSLAHPMAYFTSVFLDAQPATVIQLHGFGNERKVIADAVISTGTSDARALTPLAEALQSQGVRTLRYPDDTTELGATTNVIGAVVRQARAAFVHVELGAAWRSRANDATSKRQTRASLLLALRVLP